MSVEKQIWYSRFTSCAALRYNTRNMSIQEIVSIVLAVGFFVIVVCVAIITFFVIKALKSVSDLSNSLQDTTQNIREKLQTRAWAIVPALFVAIVKKIITRGR